MTNSIETRTHQEVQRYYGETLASSDDLKTSACCTSAAPPGYLQGVLAAIHPEVQSRYYGCGLVIPEALEGLRVLDLGCGAGRDAYVLSRLVGEQGGIVGVDMTPEQLAVARRYSDFHAEAFGYQASNVEFLEGNIERLDELELPDGSFDLIISNCVINLAVDKGAVFRSVRRLLKPGGEMYFSDVYADRRIPVELAADPVLYGECLSGALYWRDFMRMATDAGLAMPRLLEHEELAITDPDVLQKIGHIRFCSATFRVFNLRDSESLEEDYGLQVVYRGGLPEAPERWALDRQADFTKGIKTPVSGNTYRILQQSRFSEYFDLFGDFSRHLGEFNVDLSPSPFAGNPKKAQSGGCC